MKLPFIEKGFFSFGRNSSNEDLNLKLSHADFDPLPSPLLAKPPDTGLPGATLESLSSSTPLTDPEFLDQGSFFSNPDAATVTFPDNYDVLPEERNGTALTEATAYLRYPRQAVGAMGRAVNRRAHSLDRATVRRKMKRFAEDFSESLSDRINKAMEGKDAVEMLERATSLIPSVSLPNKRHVGKFIDDMSDALQKIFEHELNHASEDDDLEGSQWEFAWFMGKKARKALVIERVCPARVVMASRENLSWHAELNKKLANLYENVKDGYKLETLKSMTPIWLGDYKKKAWKLYLDTGIVELTVVDGEPIDARLKLDTGFELQEHEGVSRVEDPARSLTSIEDDEYESIESFERH